MASMLSALSQPVTIIMPIIPSRKDAMNSVLAELLPSLDRKESGKTHTVVLYTVCRGILHLLEK